MITNEPQDRKVIPYWRSVTFALKSLELEPVNAIKTPITFDERFLERRAEEWRENRRLSFALDLMGSAIVYGSYDLAKDAATFILNEGRFISPLVRRTAAKVLGDAEEMKQQSLPPQKIGLLRKSLAKFPLNPYYWVDLSLLYAQNGLWKKAERAMKAALQLAPYDRHIIRASVKFWISSPEKESERKYSMRILREKKDLVLRDPWLLATEIATSHYFEKPAKFVKHGKTMLDLYSPMHISELASGIATLEHENGQRRKGNQLFRKSAIAPNDNTIAQLAWAKKNNLIADDLSLVLRKTNIAHEANYTVFFLEGKWQKAMNKVISWKNDEQFSVTPYHAASYLGCSLLESFSAAQEICHEGLKIHHKDDILRNNLVYSLLREGKLDEASQVLSKSYRTPSEEKSKICFIANRGMLFFRSGDISAGRELYRKALSLIDRLNPAQQDFYLASAHINWAREEFLAKTEDWNSLLKKAKERVANLPNLCKKEGETALNLLEREIKAKKPQQKLPML